MPVMEIFAGPPGTGKTYSARRRAVEILTPSSSPRDFEARYADLVGRGRILFTSFHPNYTYEDFVEGYRPLLADNGILAYEVVQGPFLRICDRASVYPQSESGASTGFSSSIRPDFPLRVGQRIGQVVGGTPRYEIIEINTGGVVLRSAVERQDAVVPHLFFYVDFWTLEYLRKLNIQPDELSIAGANNERKQEMARRTHLPTTFFANSSHYRAVYEALGDYATGTTAVSPESVQIVPPVPAESNAVAQEAVLIIDEINRADLSRVFGELLTLVEVDKRVGARHATDAYLPYSRRRFSVPSGLHIVGTMNTADKSLSVFDLALRRRFTFIDCEPEPDVCSSSSEFDLPGVLTTINNRVERLKGRDYRVGHADFMDSQIEAVRMQYYSGNSPFDGALMAIAHVFKNKLIPLLSEYFRGSRRLISAILHPALFLRPVSHTTPMPDEIEVLDELQWEYNPHLDPDLPAWEADTFRQSLRQLSDQHVTPDTLNT